MQGHFRDERTRFRIQASATFEAKEKEAQNDLFVKSVNILVLLQSTSSNRGLDSEKLGKGMKFLGKFLEKLIQF